MTPPPAASILTHNLDALRAAEPDLATRLTVFNVSAFNPTPTLTRDGRTSFRLTRPDGRNEWLGRSSVPGVRAAALMEQFDPGKANVLLPGFGEGAEVEALLKKLEAHRLVFVWEADLLTIRLALALHDYAAALTAGRLVILHCDATKLAQTLADWLTRHPNIHCPDRIMVWSWQTPADVLQCRTAVETAWHQSLQQR